MDFVGTFTYVVNGHDVQAQTTGEADYKKKGTYLNKMGCPWTYESTADCRTKDGSGKALLETLGIDTPSNWDTMSVEAQNEWMAGWRERAGQTKK